MAADHRQDRNLARRMLAGDATAFDEFFDRHFPALYRFALPRLDWDPDDAEDVAQATICAAISKLATYRGDAALFTWLCTFCRHEIWALRQRTPRRVAVGTAESPEMRAALEALESNADAPDAPLAREEVARMVHDALDRLPPHYGEALSWKYLDGIPVREIAERLGLGPKAAESLLTRARQAFRDLFGAKEPGPARVSGGGGE